jgi:VCBS repeat-containing protein
MANIIKNNTGVINADSINARNKDIANTYKKGAKSDLPALSMSMQALNLHRTAQMIISLQALLKSGAVNYSFAPLFVFAFANLLLVGSDTAKVSSADTNIATSDDILNVQENNLLADKQQGVAADENDLKTTTALASDSDGILLSVALALVTSTQNVTTLNYNEKAIESVTAHSTDTHTPPSDEGGVAEVTYPQLGSVINHLAIAIDDYKGGDEDGVISGNVLLNDTAIDGGLKVIAFSGRSTDNHGTVVLLANGSFTYTPDANFNGADSFTYTIKDADGSTATATVHLTVNSVNDLPVAVADSFSVDEDAILTGALATNDTLSGDGGNVWALASAAAHGTVVINADGTFTYTPTANYQGSDSFIYKITDSNGDVTTATVSLTVNSVNDLPVVVADSFTTDEDVVLSGNLATNDTLSGDGGNVWALASAAAHGAVVINADGTFTYTPTANYNGGDSFSYTLTDSNGDVVTATVSLTVNPVNDLPVAVADSFTTNEDVALSGNLAANDTASGDGGNVWALASAAAHGTVVINADGTFTYTPTANYNGGDSFSYTLTDSNGDVVTATVSLTVNSINDLPVAAADSFTTNEDVVLNGNLATNDTASGDGGNSWTLKDQAGHGVVTVNADGTFTYTPTANYQGSDSFSYTLTDSNGDISTATVSLTVNSVNDLPIAVADSFATDEDVVLSGNLATNDTLSGDGGNVWALASAAAHGAVVINADGTFTYTPTANYNGGDSFSYTLTDSNGDVVTATVSLTVNPVNDLPVAVADSFTTNEDVALSGNLAANDTASGDGGNVWALASAAAHGTVVINANGTFTYTPTANYNGSDSFSYTLTDSNGDVVTATVSLTVNPVNDLPVAVADSFATNEDVVLNGNLATNDTASGDGGNSWALKDQASHGVATVNANGTFTYTPTANYYGSDSFSYTLTDSNGDISTASVSLTVNSVNDLPVAVADSFTTNEDVVLSGNLATNDTLSGDGGNVWALASAAAHGTVVMNANGTFTYTPTANYNGGDNFSYTLTDSNGDISTATVSLTVNSVNDLPVAAADSFTTNEDVVLNGNLATNDTASGDGGNSWALKDQASHGVVTVNANGTFTYTPAANYYGSDSFSYTLTDSNGDISTASVSLTVNSVNDLPVAVADSFTTNEDVVLSGNLATNDTLSGDGGNVWALASAAAHGTVVMNANGTFTYTPAANYNGGDSFSYTLTDSNGDISTATVSLTVNSVNDLPVAAADSFTTNEDVVLNGNLAANDTVSGDGGNVWALASAAAHGTVVINANGTFTYTPRANYNGSDAFTYALTDSNGDLVTATVSLTVNSVNDLPVAVVDSFITDKNAALNGNLATNDTLSGDGGNVWALKNGASHGSVVVNADGTFTYNPSANYSGSDSFTYTLTDSNGDVSTATVVVMVNSPTQVGTTGADGADGAVYNATTGAGNAGAVGGMGENLSNQQANNNQFAGTAGNDTFTLTRNVVGGVGGIGGDGSDGRIAQRGNSANGTVSVTAGPGGVAGAGGMGGDVFAFEASANNFQGAAGADILNMNLIITSGAGGAGGVSGIDGSGLPTATLNSGTGGNAGVAFLSVFNNTLQGGDGSDILHMSLTTIGGIGGTGGAGKASTNGGVANAGAGGGSGHTSLVANGNMLQGGSDADVLRMDLTATGGAGGSGGVAVAAVAAPTSGLGASQGTSGSGGAGGIGGEGNLSITNSTLQGDDGNDILMMNLLATGGAGGAGTNGAHGLVGGNNTSGLGGAGQPGGYGGSGGSGGTGGAAYVTASGNYFVGGSGNDVITLNVLATAGAGGVAGIGGAGGDGGPAPVIIAPGEIGFGSVGKGGDGGNGGNGGNGGDAAITIASNHFGDAAVMSGSDNDTFNIIATAVGGSAALGQQGGNPGTGSGALGGDEPASGTTGTDGQAGNATISFNNNILSPQSGDDVINIALTATAGSDGSNATVATLNFNDNAFTGGDGNDILHLALAASGDSTIYNFQNNNFDGGNGVDTLDLSGTTVAVSVDLNNSTNAIILGSGTSSGNTITNIENLIGTSFNDSLQGNASNNLLVGGAGSDTLTGGGGSDTFKYNSLLDVNDHITDFTTGSVAAGGDVLDLTDLLNSFSGYNGVNAFTGGYLQFDNSSGHTVVKVDADGHGGSAAFVTLVSLDNAILQPGDTTNYMM